MLPKISVVVPSYNQGMYLDDCLRSIIGQAYPSLELLVMDGGSTDNSVDIIQSHGSSITFWRSEQDGGQAAAINEGFARASGDVLCWLNSDDLYLPGTLGDIARRALGQSDACWLCYGESIIMREPADKGDQLPFVVPAETRAFEPAVLRYSDYIVQPSSFWTRALWDETGPLRDDLHYAFDWEWFLRATVKGAFTYVPRFYSIYRQHPLHKSGQGSEARRQELLEIIDNNAPPYWRELYHELDRAFTAWESWEKKLRTLNVRGARRLLPLLFPRLFSRLRTRTDLTTALSMWR
jgi:glycosyltransferase involved in cell wall biosynthesis